VRPPVIVGVGIHRFGRTEGVSGREQAAVAARLALEDAGITWREVQVAVGGSMAAGAADSLVNELGLTGLPFVNVFNGCATGGSALLVATSMIESGSADVAMAIGFDKHERGAFNPRPRQSGLDSWYGRVGLMLTTQFFGMRIQRYMHDYGIDAAMLGAVAAKAYRNGARADHAWRRTPIDEAAIAASPMVNHPLTKFMFCSPGEGAVAVILARGADAHRYMAPPVHVRAVTQKTREYGSFEVFSPSLAPERTDNPTVQAARDAFEASAVAPDDVDVAQIQDTDAGAEIIHMAETGLCDHGDQGALIADGCTDIGGRLPINTDGGCLANGEPIGASGLRQVYETVMQLRGSAGTRQVPGMPSVGFTHVYGAPGVSACTILTR
jgi:acetyl-CoA acetyltransferase